MAFDPKVGYYYTIRDIILQCNGIIYGGFICSMILMKANCHNFGKSNALCPSRIWYPDNIDVVISISEYNIMIDHMKNDRGYTIKKKPAQTQAFKTTESGNIHLMEKIEVTNGKDTVLLDITILVSVQDANKNSKIDMLYSFFEDMPLDFEANRLVYEGNRVKYNSDDKTLFTVQEPEYGLEIKKITRDIINKVAVLMVPISEVSEYRIKDMLNMGFKIISADRSVRWIENPLNGNKDINCLVCHEKINTKWIAMQNISNPDCKCKMTYLCASINILNPGVSNECIIKTKDTCLYCKNENKA